MSTGINRAGCVLRVGEGLLRCFCDEDGSWNGGPLNYRLQLCCNMSVRSCLSVLHDHDLGIMRWCVWLALSTATHPSTPKS